MVSTDRRVLLGKIKETNLSHVKDLNAMLVRLRSNDHIILESTNLSPDSRLGTGVLW
jgi:hypothetical protein